MGIRFSVSLVFRGYSRLEFEDFARRGSARLFSVLSNREGTARVSTNVVIETPEGRLRKWTDGVSIFESWSWRWLSYARIPLRSINKPAHA